MELSYLTLKDSSGDASLLMYTCTSTWRLILCVVDEINLMIIVLILTHEKHRYITLAVSLSNNFVINSKLNVPAP